MLLHNLAGKVLVLVQLPSLVGLFGTPWTAAHQASLSFIISLILLKIMSIELVIPSNHLILCRPLLLLLSIFPSIRVFSTESVLCIRWPKHWSISFNIGPSNEYSGLIFFRMDWYDLLAVPVKSLSRVQSPWTVAYQVLPSMGFSRQEYSSGLPFPSPIQD